MIAKRIGWVLRSYEEDPTPLFVDELPPIEEDSPLTATAAVLVIGEGEKAPRVFMEEEVKELLTQIIDACEAVRNSLSTFAHPGSLCGYCRAGDMGRPSGRPYFFHIKGCSKLIAHCCYCCFFHQHIFTACRNKST